MRAKRPEGQTTFEGRVCVCPDEHLNEGEGDEWNSGSGDGGHKREGGTGRGGEREREKRVRASAEEDPEEVVTKGRTRITNRMSANA
jgi:hypothetical protein